MSHETFTITLTADQKATLEAKAVAAGINPSGGTLPKKNEVVLSFVVSGNVVTFTVLEKPRLMFVAFIKHGVEKYINEEI
jgi:hypothetical protein